eukprot:CAMPEP_0171299070 /NCGR_PEP_ID=MMETSP0816-20121228/7848_1 /TAXON_ID=420281 /ORGANISM="Proboscia inermis, Strain CCAP1064/1" /LENGTH=69 /DNA_ID=CAMNT_0011774553 /DNA_START=602 /DNA_END=811 /DNA_ORIENTATION=+
MASDGNMLIVGKDSLFPIELFLIAAVMFMDCLVFALKEVEASLAIFIEEFDIAVPAGVIVGPRAVMQAA